MSETEPTFEILQHASGFFLTDELPDNWEDLEDEERDAFLREHAWEPVENFSSDELWDVIENAAISTQRFLNKQQNKG